MNLVEEDWDLLTDRNCTNIRAITIGAASLVYGYQRETKRRLYIMRYADKSTKFHLPARATSHAKREAFWMRRFGIVQVCPEADSDTLALVKEAVGTMKAA